MEIVRVHQNSRKSTILKAICHLGAFKTMRKKREFLQNLSGQNPLNFGDWGKVLPERDQRRSGRENHVILQSVT